MSGKTGLRMGIITGGLLPVLLLLALNAGGGMTRLCGFVRTVIARAGEEHTSCHPGKPCSSIAPISAHRIYETSPDFFLCLYLPLAGCNQTPPPLSSCPACDNGGHIDDEYELLRRPREIRSPAAPAPQQIPSVMVYSRGSTPPLRPVHIRPPGFVNTTVLRI